MSKTMKRITLIMVLIFTNLFAQNNVRFVNYGPKAEKSEGDDNGIQIINFELPKDYRGKISLQIFDPDCVGNNDSRVNDFNSEFRFSVYRGEVIEDLKSDLKIKSKLKPQLLTTKTFGQNVEYDNQWFDFTIFSADSLIDNKFSLVCAATSGDDANSFEVKVVNPETGVEIKNTKIYSYQPTLRLLNIVDIYSFKINPDNNSSIKIHTFDSDADKIFISTILKDKIQIKEDNPSYWNEAIFPLNEFEKGNLLSFEFQPKNLVFNDFTFFITDSTDNKIPIDLTSYKKNQPIIPLVNYQIKYLSCDKLEFTVDLSSTSSCIWKFHDGSVYNTSSFTKDFNANGKYSASLFVEEKSDAITRAKLIPFDFKINQLPKADAGIDKIAAPYEQITFDASMSYDNDGTIRSFIWDFGNGNIKEGKVVKNSFTSSGKYLVTLKVRDDFQEECNSSLDSLYVTVNSSPILKTNDLMTGSPNQSITFDASKSYDSDGEIKNIVWDFGNLGRKKGAVVTQSFPQPGIYSVELFVQDDSPASNNTSSAKIKVMINSKPSAIAGKNKIIAENEELILDGSNSKDQDGNIISYKWIIKNNVYEGMKVNHTFTTHGNYIIKLIVKDDSQTMNDSDTTSISITVNERPKATIENEKYLNNGNAKFDGSKSFDNDGRITKYLWDFGDGSTGIGEFVTHNYQIPGKYIVTLKVFDDTNVSNNFSINTSFVIINKRPIADAGIDYLISPEKRLEFSSEKSIDPDGRIAKVKWIVNDKLVSENSSFSYTFNEAGKYIIGLEVIDDFVKPLSSYDEAIVIVNKPPVAKINCITKATPNQKIKFDASNSYDEDGKLTNYKWQIDNETKSFNKTFDYSFSKAGTYQVILSVDDDAKVENSTSSDTVFVKINSSPIIKTDDQIVTCEKIIQFDASSSFDPDGDDILFSWKFPESEEKFYGPKLFHEFKEFGIFPVVLTIDDKQGLSNSIIQKTLLIKIHQPPLANAGNDTTVCAEDIIILSGLKSKASDGSVLSYEWIFDDSTKLFGSTAVKTFKHGGIYNVVLKVIDDSGLPCNSSLDSKIIKVIDSPHANAGEDINTCVGTPTKFDGTKSTDIDGIVNSFTWDFGDEEFGGGTTPIHIYEKPGKYKVTLTITGDLKGNCDNVSQDDLIVNVFDGPVANFTSIDSTDQNTILTFDASKSVTNDGKIISYDWDFGDGSKGNGKIANHSYTQSGEYNVTLKITTDSKTECNSASSSRLIYINAKPIAKIKAISHAAENENIIFDASESHDPNGKISKFIWDFGDGEHAEGIQVFHSYKKTGNYKVHLKVFDDTNTKLNSAEELFDIKINASPNSYFKIKDKYFINEKILLDGSKSNDVDGKIINYFWYVNDSLYSTKRIDEIKFEKSGLYNIKLVIQDDSNDKNKFGFSSASLSVLDYPKIEITKNIYFCVSQPSTITAKFDPEFKDKINFKWLLDNKILSEATYCNVSFFNSGTKNIIMKVYDYSGKLFFEDTIKCFVNDNTKVKENYPRFFYIGSANDEIIIDANDFFENLKLYYKINWTIEGNQFKDVRKVLYRFKKTGNYKISIEIDDIKNTNCSKNKFDFNVIVQNLIE